MEDTPDIHENDENKCLNKSRPGEKDLKRQKTYLGNSNLMFGLSFWFPYVPFPAKRGS